jgi:hypothetical protein
LLILGEGYFIFLKSLQKTPTPMNKVHRECGKDNNSSSWREMQKFGGDVLFNMAKTQVGWMWWGGAWREAVVQV